MVNMNNPFEEVDKEALLYFITRTKKYGNSWMTMPLHDLQTKLQEECAELLEKHDIVKIHELALDVLNTARMIAERTK